MNFADYGSLLTQAYDIDKPEAPALEFEWHRSFIADAQPALAAMCGSGRFLVPLRAAGLDVDGVDASPHMLAACRAKLDAQGLDANIYEQKLQDLDLPRHYRSISIGGGGSFGLIRDPDDANQAVRRLRGHLTDGGTLRLEVQTPAVLAFARMGRPRVRSWVRPDGARIVLTDTVVGIHGNVTESIGKYELFKDGRLIETELDEFPTRLYTPDEMKALITGAGFETVSVTKAYSEEPPADDELMVTVKAS